VSVVKVPWQRAQRAIMAGLYRSGPRPAPRRRAAGADGPC
jgi:hypothetical protein